MLDTRNATRTRPQPHERLTQDHTEDETKDRGDGQRERGGTERPREEPREKRQEHAERSDGQPRPHGPRLPFPMWSEVRARGRESRW